MLHIKLLDVTFKKVQYVKHVCISYFKEQNHLYIRRIGKNLT